MCNLKNKTNERTTKQKYIHREQTGGCYGEGGDSMEEIGEGGNIRMFSI